MAMIGEAARRGASCMDDEPPAAECWSFSCRQRGALLGAMRAPCTRLGVRMVAWGLGRPPGPPAALQKRSPSRALAALMSTPPPWAAIRPRAQVPSAEANAGGGLVTVKVNGRFELLSCVISEDAMKLNDREMLEDLVVAATNQALNKVREQLAAESAKMAAGMGLPPGLLGGAGFPGLG